MTMTAPFVLPRTFAFPGYAITQTGWYLEVETDTIVEVSKLPMSGMVATREIWTEGESTPRVEAVILSKSTNRFRGPLPAPSKLFV